MTGLIALGLLLAFVFIGPPIKRGAKGARNTPVGIELPFANDIEPQSPRGVKAQEVAEFRLAWLCGLIPAIPFAILVEGPLSGLALIVAALAMLLARKLTNHFDFVGHNIEIAVAEAEGREGYRQQEIERMVQGDQRGMTAAQVDAQLKRWEWLARIARVLT